jgi:hypothetical protein
VGGLVDAPGAILYATNVERPSTRVFEFIGLNRVRFNALTN